MAYRNENVPVIDLNSPLNVLPHYTDVTTVKGAATKDSLGRYVSGTFKVTHENVYASFDYSRDLNYNAEVFMQLYNVKQTGSKPMCIISMHPNYGFTNSISSGQALTGEKNLVESYSNRQAYIYFLAVLGDRSGITLDGVNKRARVTVTTSASPVGTYPLYSESTGQNPSSGIDNQIFSINQVKDWMDWANTGRSSSYTTQRFTPQQRVEAERWTAEEPFTEYGNQISLYRIADNMVTGQGVNAQLYPVIAGKITANIPVFDMLQTQAIYDYFKEGKIDGAGNLDDIAVSDISLATDWTIYVKGKRYPNIFVTMASTELDDFLADPEKNVGGLSASDFKVEYRYRHYTDDIIINLKEPEIIDMDSMSYNDTKTTSWKEIVNMMYGDTSIIGSILADSEGVYAELQFRIYYNEEIWSRWCYFKIGYIGSPTVEDFSKMNNEGDVVSISDGSTVTIIYDEFPPDDDYKDPDDDSDVTDTENDGSVNTGLNLLTTSYRVTDSNVQKLGNELWEDNFIKNIKLLNNSPIENIVGLKVMPCNVTAYSNQIVIGNVPTDIEGDVIASVPVVTVGSFYFKGYYGNFLDYAPYTQATLFLPFIGHVELDPAEFTEHTLTVKYAFDIVMGQCKAMLFADDIYVQSFDGICGIDVPLVASNRAQVEGSVAASMASSALAGDIVGVASSYLTRQYHSQRSGGYSPVLGWVETRNCFITLTIPNAQYATTYGHDEGYPCNLSCNLGTLTGFTVCDSNIDMRGFTCTEEEKAMIKEKLTKGVYL